MKTKIKPIPKWALLLCLLLSGTYYLFGWYIESRTYSKDQIEQMFEPIKSKYGIRIVYEIGPDFFPPIDNPSTPKGREQKRKVVPMEHFVLARYPYILQTALERYPVKVIREYLKAIYLAKELNEDGFKYGGTYDPSKRIMYLANNGNYSDIYSIGAFHHEFSSLMLCRHSFLLNPWFNQNTKGFSYIRNDRSATWKSIKGKYGNLLEGTGNEYEKGFMNIYGKTDFENDFNEYAAMIFTYPQKFKKIMNQYPRVRGKFLVFLDFYHKIDPIFTEEYLLGKKQMAAR